MSARWPLARRRPLATADAQLSSPVARSSQVSGSVSTTLDGRERRNAHFHRPAWRLAGQQPERVADGRPQRRPYRLATRLPGRRDRPQAGLADSERRDRPGPGRLAERAELLVERRYRLFGVEGTGWHVGLR
jgi:hypothetical protein